MHKRNFLNLMAGVGLTAISALTHAQDNSFKVGLILPMSGPFAATGKQLESAARLYMAQNGDTVAGRKLVLIVKDDTGSPEVTKRIAQELVVNDKVQVLAGFGLTPLAMATAPVATQSKTPMVVMAAATSSITQASPYVVRTSFTLPQAAVAMADWAPNNGIKKVVTLVSDYGPGIDAEKFFKDRMLFNGAQVLDTLRVPMRNPDFAPFLQKVRDLKPDAVFVFVPSGAGAALMKQFSERGMDKAGIKLIGTGDITDDDQVQALVAERLAEDPNHIVAFAWLQTFGHVYGIPPVSFQALESAHAAPASAVRRRRAVLSVLPAEPRAAPSAAAPISPPSRRAAPMAPITAITSIIAAAPITRSRAAATSSSISDPQQ